MKKNPTKRFNVAIVGGGPGSEAVMKLIMADTFSELRMTILGVAIQNPEAPARKCADELGLYITEEYKDLYEIKDLDLIIELTGQTQARPLGYAKHELIGKHITELLIEDSATP